MTKPADDLRATLPYMYAADLAHDAVTEAVELLDECERVLAYYEADLKNCNKFTPEGEAARAALARDCGVRARLTLAKLRGTP